jgi:hypothetical protein
MASFHSHSAHHPAVRANDGMRALPDLTSRRGELVTQAARYLGALSLFAVGAVHAQQYYYAFFSSVPTIGVLFLLSFIGAGVLGLVLIAPVRKLGENLGDLILVLAALGGIGIAFGSLVSLMISEYTPLFGFMESGYRLAIVLALVSDALTTVLLGVFVLLVVRAYRARAASGQEPDMKSVAEDRT